MTTTPDEPRASAPLRTVLIVDDMADLRRLVANKLNASGKFLVTANAGDGLEALEQADELCAEGHPPDVVLLDLSMPRMSGAAALPQLREKLPDALIVVFSGFEHADMVPHLRADGADHFVEKGVRRLSELVDQLDAWARDR